MMARTLSAAARAIDGRLYGADAEYGAVVTDTRTLPAGALYVAIRGERFDGNDFVKDAQEKGAVGALVSRRAEVPLPQVLVGDTRRAFGQLAREWRRNFAIPVVAVTGSSGKTTVKELIAAILSVHHPVCVTQGNLNNDIGVPLTLLRLKPEHAALVIELGANHSGEIDYLASLAEPTIGVLTNAAPAHLEGFGSLEGIAAAKGELFDHLPRAGTAVINADDRFRNDWIARAPCDAVTFGLAASADCTLVGTPQFDASGASCTIKLPDGEHVDVRLPLLGMQNVVNALAAAAAAHAAGADAEQIAAGLARVQPVRGRMRSVAGLRGAVIVDDSYNANPSSVRAALDYLGSLGGRRIMVLGDMAELGPNAPQLHREIGRYATARCDQLVTVGKLAAEAAAEAGAMAAACEDIAAARALVEPQLAAGVTVLVKGSRVMGLERLVESLAAPPQQGASAC